MTEHDTDELEELIEQKVEEATADLRDELEHERERRREEEARADRLEERVDALEERVDRAERVARASVAHARRLHERADDLDDWIGSSVEGIHARISSVQEGVSEVEESTVEVEEAKLPIQQLAEMPEHVAERHLDNENHRNSYRARGVWRDLDDYADRAPVGYVLRSGDLQRVLRALDEEGRTIESRTAQRVMDRIVEFTQGIAKKERRKGEWCLVVPEDWREQADALEESRSDDVVTGIP